MRRLRDAYRSFQKRGENPRMNKLLIVFVLALTLLTGCIGNTGSGTISKKEVEAKVSQFVAAFQAEDPEPIMDMVGAQVIFNDRSEETTAYPRHSFYQFIQDEFSYWDRHDWRVGGILTSESYNTIVASLYVRCHRNWYNLEADSHTRIDRDIWSFTFTEENGKWVLSGWDIDPH